MNGFEYLKDLDFLKTIDNLTDRTEYVKIVLLDYQERELSEIQGRATSGSINIDGQSSIRRAGNFTFIPEEGEGKITSHNKIKLLIGIKNTTDQYPEYPIIWFPLGVFVITDVSYSTGTGGTSFSVQVKDKMCLLNGEAGGVIPASVEFHQLETLNEDGEVIIEKPTIYQIIQELVNHFGEEQLGKIVIRDVDSKVKQVMKWVGSAPVFLIETIETDEETGTEHKVQKLTTNEAEVANLDTGSYREFNYGEDIGYIYTDFTYPGELVSNAGQSVCDILDTIKNTLGNYEYFYDLDGNFIFQEVRNFLNTSKSTMMGYGEQDLNVADYMFSKNTSQYVYDFSGSNIVTSYSNNPQYREIKNDFIVWGVRKDGNDTEFPIRYHLAIDSKPIVKNTYRKVFYYQDPDDDLIKIKVPIFTQSKDDSPVPRMKSGDFQSFYYTVFDGKNYIWKWKKEWTSVDAELIDFEATDWRTELYLQGAEAESFGRHSNYYYTELVNEWPKLYDLQNNDFYDDTKNNITDLDFYLDFIDANGPLKKYSVDAIGRRSKIVNDNKINCIFEPEIPDFIILRSNSEDIKEKRDECINKGQSFIQCKDEIYMNMVAGGSYNSAFVMIKELLNQYTNLQESISISALPIYYLEPNVLVMVKDDESEIFGEYLINSISISFDISSTMTLSCNKNIQKY